jgi:Fic family protein
MKKPESPPAPNGLLPATDDLINILENKELLEKLSEIEEDYPYWESFKYKAKALNFDTVKLWGYVKFRRRSSLNPFHISTEKGFSFQYSTTGKILKLLHEFDLNLGGVLEGGSIIPNEDKNKFLMSSIMEEAIASSQLEGAVTTREVAKEMLRTQRRPRDLSEKMILNNYLTIKRITELKNKELSKDLILEIHSLISKGTLKNENNEGAFRKNNNIKVADEISGEIFYDPPDYKLLDGLINSLCEFANCKTDKYFIHPIVRAITIHFLIGYIHPFVDGNGRTARAIFYWFLISRGYWLMEYLSVSRIILKSPNQYAKAYLFTEYDDNDLTYFINFNLKSMDLALKSLKEYIQRKIKEKKQLFNIVKNENINERQAEILKDLIYDSQKTISIKQVKAKFNVVYQTARTDVFGLVELGYLKERLVGNKFIFFRSDNFDEKMRALKIV